MPNHRLGQKLADLAALDAQIRAALGADSITGLSADSDGITAHFTGTPTPAQLAQAIAIVNAHVPPPPPPTEQQQWQSLEAEIEAASSTMQIRAAMLKMAKLKARDG